MAKEKTTPENPSEPIETQTQKAPKPKAVEVAAALISSEVDNTVVPSRMPGSYLTVDPRMDSSPITVKFSAKEAPELVLEDIVDSSGQSGARDIAIPLDYLTKLMGFTAHIVYTGRSQGQAVASLAKEVGISFYPASESEGLAPYLADERIVDNTPTYDMRLHKGDETVYVPVPPLAKAGDKVYCTAVTEQDVVPYTFYSVADGYVLTAEKAVPGTLLPFIIKRGWLARRKQWRAITLQSAWITSGLPAEPPADVDPHLETRLPANALEIQRRRTAALIVDPGLDLPPPRLRQSVGYNGEWCLNPELTKDGGDVDVPGLDTYAGDRVCFFVSGPDDARKPLGCVAIENDGGRASVTLSPCIVACFFNKSMKLTYTLAFNESEQASPAQVVSVLVPRFIHPNVEEATNGTVDLKTFTGAALATVPVWAYAECSNLCWMWFTGERQNGSAYRFDILQNEPVTEDWKASGVEARIPRAELQKLADCSEFELHFAASFCDSSGLGNAYEFPAQAFRIELEPLVLLEPSVREAVDNDLTIWNGRDGVHIEVDYVGNHSSHSISVCWAKPDGSCLPLAAQPGSDAGAVVFFVPREAVIESSGKTVKINYTVTTACKVQTSADWYLTISTPVRLPTPVVLQATPPATQNGILDLRTFNGDANITVEKWWFILSGQTGWLECTGTADENGAPYIIKVSTADPITSDEVLDGLNKLLKRTELEKLRNKTPFIVKFQATPDVGGAVGNAIEFPELNLEFRKAFYDYTDFNPNGNGWNNWQKGAGATDPLDLVLKSGPMPGGEIGYFLFDWGYTNTSNPVTQREKLYKTFTQLEAGRRYRLSAWVRDNSNVGNKPNLVLVAGGQEITPQTRPGAAWQKLQGEFTANSTPIRLSLDNLQMGIAPGNDFDVTQITVEEA